MEITKIFILKAMAFAMLFPFCTQAQDEDRGNTGHVTGAQFLALNSDVVGSGMANLRNFVPGSPYSIGTNMAKGGFVSEEFLHSFGIGYTPLARGLTDDIKILNLSTQHWVAGSSYIGIGLHYLGYGDMTFADGQGNPTGFHRPNEFAVSLGYAQRFGEFFSLGITPKYVRTNLSGNALSAQNTYVNANTFAVDLSMYGEYVYGQTRYATNAVTYGLTVQNLGMGINYNINDVSTQLPTNLSGGLGIRSDSDDVGYIVGAEVSYPLYGDDFLQRGATKLGFALGGEISFMQQFMVRAGFLKENAYRSNVSFATLGAGITFDVSDYPFTVNASYQLPIANTTNGMTNVYSVGISVGIFDGR